MRNLSNVTLIATDGTGTNKNITKAMQYSKKGLKFADCVLLSPSSEYSNTEGIDIINIEKMSYEDWNKFMLFEADKHFTTSHYLFIDTDGFVINPNLWNDSFLEYDYIGASWDYHTHITNSPVVDDVVKQKGKAVTNLVGNGGFTMRSKKLTSLIPKCTDTRYTPEDVFLCINNYEFFKEQGVKYAPIELANLFSQDPLVNKNNTFGFHGDKNHINKITL